MYFKSSRFVEIHFECVLIYGYDFCSFVLSESKFSIDNGNIYMHKILSDINLTLKCILISEEIVLYLTSRLGFQSSYNISNIIKPSNNGSAILTIETVA